MITFVVRCSITLCLIGLLWVPASPLSAQQAAATGATANPHPLQPVVAYGSEHANYIRANVRDFSCKLMKRERIDGKLQGHQLGYMVVRCEQRYADGSGEPLSVFMQFVAPKSIRDRRVLYVADQHDGKVLVRKGGRVVKFVRVKVDPFGDKARRESSKPITEVGFDKLLDDFARRAHTDMQRDPTAANTQVSYFENVDVNNRQCKQIRIMHPRPTAGMEYHIADLFIDNELHVPARFVTYGWPQRAGAEPPVNEEYNYAQVQLNLGLTDANFSEELLEMPYRPRVAGEFILAR